MSGGATRKPGFDITGQFRTARAGEYEVYWDAYARDAEIALAVSPCSSIRMLYRGRAFGGLIGPQLRPPRAGNRVEI